MFGQILIAPDRATARQVYAAAWAAHLLNEPATRAHKMYGQLLDHVAPHAAANASTLDVWAQRALPGWQSYWEQWRDAVRVAQGLPPLKRK